MRDACMRLGEGMLDFQHPYERVPPCGFKKAVEAQSERIDDMGVGWKWLHGGLSADWKVWENAGIECKVVSLMSALFAIAKDSLFHPKTWVMLFFFSYGMYN